MITDDYPNKKYPNGFDFYKFKSKKDKNTGLYLIEFFFNQKPDKRDKTMVLTKEMSMPTLIDTVITAFPELDLSQLDETCAIRIHSEFIYKKGLKDIVEAYGDNLNNLGFERKWDMMGNPYCKNDNSQELRFYEHLPYILAWGTYNLNEPRNWNQNLISRLYVVE
ncbi:MAG: hypothetical protein LBV04_04365 [Deferribacteraceae bacterium]|jgi:hypothetical protein|nr:hypothetical protein [Deferribacteraceae bacterium]